MRLLVGVGNMRNNVNYQRENILRKSVYNGMFNKKAHFIRLIVIGEPINISFGVFFVLLKDTSTHLPVFFACLVKSKKKEKKT